MKRSVYEFNAVSYSNAFQRSKVVLNATGITKLAGTEPTEYINIMKSEGRFAGSESNYPVNRISDAHLF